MNTINTMTVRDFAILRLQRKALARKIEQLRSTVARAAFNEAMRVLDEQIAMQPPKAAKVPANRKKAAIQAHLTRATKALKGTRGKKRMIVNTKIAELTARLIAFDAPPAPKRTRKPRGAKVAPTVVDQPTTTEQIAA